MCHAKPGPRCSAHTKKTLQRCAFLLNSVQKTGNTQMIQQAKKDLEIAKYEWYTSPEGLKKLQERIKVTQQWGDSEKVRKWTLLYEKASADRAGRMAAYQRMVAAKEQSSQPGFASRVRALFSTKEV